MELSRNWLAHYVELPESAEELAAGLTAAGHAVEGMTERGDDLLLDVDVTTNRPDCMSHFGLAREVAAIFGRELTPPESACAESAEATADHVAVELADGDCRRYVARLVRGVTVGPSPPWLARRLESIGQRPINNVVDVTNFVLWETGQPIHAFDFAKVTGGRIVVRAAGEGETLVTLDGERRELDPEVLVIADAERPVALAGIMGGLETEVGEGSTDVLVESAHFDPRRTRRGAGRLGMHTDASHRFERGADFDACRWAADRVARLLAEVAGGTVLAGAVDEVGTPPRELKGTVDASRLSAFAGAPFDADGVAAALASVGFAVERRGDGVVEATVPGWRWYDFADGRPDGRVWEADLYEEVLRLTGFDGIPSALPALGEPDAGSSAEHRLRHAVRRHLAGLGLVEAVTYAFQSPAEEDSIEALRRAGEALQIANPLSEKLSVMRRSLLPGLVESARFNLRRGAQEVRLYEIGRCFPGGDAEELETVAVVAGGHAAAPWDRPAEFDLFDLKGIVESLAERFGAELAAQPTRLAGFLTGASARLTAGGETVGHLGRLEGDFPVPLFGAELATSLLAGGEREGEVVLPSRFPGIAIDLTLTHSAEVPWAEVAAAVEAFDTPHLVGFHLKDRYRGEGVPEGAVNTTLGFLYNAEERSLTRDEVQATHERLAAELERAFGWSE